MTFRRAGTLAIAVSVATLVITTASTARPPTTPSTVDTAAFQPLVLPGAPVGSAWPTFELGRPASPVPIGDFQAAQRSFEARVTPDQPVDVDSVLKPTPKPPKPRYSRSGSASWYCKAGESSCHYQYSGGMYAAAGPALRVGDWRGRLVRVCADGRCVQVRLIDWCACYGSRVIDLYSDAYRQIAPLSSGTTRVTVFWW